MSTSGKEAARGRKMSVKTPKTMRREPSSLDTKAQVQRAQQAPLRRHSFRQYKVIYQSLRSMKMKIKSLMRLENSSQNATMTSSTNWFILKTKTL